MAMMAQAPTIAREYLQRAIAAGQAKGQAYLILGLVAVLADDDLETARKQWRRAERIARKEGDEELLDRIEIARTFFSTPPGLLDLLRDAALFPEGFDPDEWILEDIDDEDMHDEDADDDDIFHW
jgi:tetratricopeptide (TPR) repeat protein